MDLVEADDEANGVDDAEFARLRRMVQESRDHFAEWRSEARDDYGFVAGDQYTRDDKAVLAEQNRPLIVFNRVAPVIDAVSGQEVSNRQEVRYIPRTVEDAGINETLTATADYFRDECEAEDEESDAFADMLICGEGCTETSLEFDVDPEGMIVINRVDPLEMYWDPSASKRNHADAKYVARVKEMALRDAKAMFPEAAESDLDATWIDASMGDGEPHDREAARWYASGQVHERQKHRVVIVEVQFYDLAPYYQVAMPDGQMQEVSEDEIEAVESEAAAMGVPLEKVRMKKRVYRRAFLGSKLLHLDDSPSQIGFTYEGMTGRRDRNKRTYYGLVRAMRDPQRWANAWMAQILHIINTNAKGGPIIQQDALVGGNVREFEEKWADPAATVVVQDIQKFLQRQPPALPPGLAQLLEFAVSSIRDVSGVSLEILGLAERDQPGVLEYQRKQAGLTILAGFFDALRRYRKSQGKLMLHYIARYIADGRIVRIVGDAGAKYVRFINDAEAIQYDVIVDQAPTSPNQKEKTFAVLSQMLPMFGNNIPPDLIPMLLEYAPLPQSLIEKVQEMRKKPDPEAEQQKRLALQGAQAEVAKTASEIELNKAKAESEKVKAGADFVGALRQTQQPAAPEGAQPA